MAELGIRLTSEQEKRLADMNALWLEDTAERIFRDRARSLACEYVDALIRCEEVNFIAYNSAVVQVWQAGDRICVRGMCQGDLPVDEENGIDAFRVAEYICRKHCYSVRSVERGLFMLNRVLKGR